MLDAVRDFVRRRGWSERTTMLALGGDIRPEAGLAANVVKGRVYRAEGRWAID